MVEHWKVGLASVSEKAANSLADPVQYENLFPDFELALKAERLYSGEAMLPAAAYGEVVARGPRDLLDGAFLVHCFLQRSRG